MAVCRLTPRFNKVSNLRAYQTPLFSDDIVARTEAQLQARLATQKAIPVASSFRSLEDAERVVSLTIRANKGIIKEWAKSALSGQTKAISFEAG